MFTTKNRRQRSAQPTVFFGSSWSESEEKHLKKLQKVFFDKASRSEWVT